MKIEHVYLGNDVKTMTFQCDKRFFVMSDTDNPRRSLKKLKISQFHN